VEGIFAHFEDSSTGRVARFEIAIGRDRGEGLVVIYRDGRDIEIVAIDSTGRSRPGWAAAIRQRPLGLKPVIADAGAQAKWTTLIRRVGSGLDRARRPYAIAAIVVRP
jgi:hypothetical protein